METRRVKNPGDPGGFMTINADDFDAEVHEPYDDEEIGDPPSAEYQFPPLQDGEFAGIAKSKGRSPGKK